MTIDRHDPVGKDGAPTRDTRETGAPASRADEEPREADPSASRAVPFALDAPERLTTLSAVEAAHHRANPVLDRLARMIARLLDAPIAAVSLILPSGQRFLGLSAPDAWNDGARETPLSVAVCQHVVASGQALVVGDATTSSLTASETMRRLQVQAYIGVPLVTREGIALGACCAMDLRAHHWTSDDRAVVEDLATLAMAEIERGVAEDRLVTALDAVQDGVWEWDMTTDHGYVSPQWNRLHGLPPMRPAPTSFEWAQMVHPEDQGQVQATVAAHARGETAVYASEYRARQSDGSWRWMLGRGRIVARDAEGRPLRMLGTVTDVTEYREARVLLAQREAYYRNILDTLPVGVAVANATGSPVFENDRLSEIWGGREDVAAMAEYDRYKAWWPSTGQRVQADEWAMSRALTRGETCNGEQLEIERFDGERAIILHHAAPLRDAMGQVVGAVTAVTDITQQERERMRREEALRASEERYMLAARATRDVICEWNAETREVLAGAGMSSLFGDDPGGAARSAAWWMDRIHPQDRERVLTSVRAFIATAAADGTWHESLRLRRGDGSYAVVEAHGTAVRDLGGRLRRMVIAFEDTTATRQLEERLRHAEKLKALGQLAGGIAHDFNNLLTVISGGVGLAEAELQDGTHVPAGVKGALGDVRSAAARAATLVRQLLTFSRKGAAPQAPVHVGNVLHECEKLLGRLLSEEITLEVRSKVGDAYVLSDAGQLEQIVFNLATNARDAMLTARHGTLGVGGTLRIAAGVVEHTVVAGGAPSPDFETLPSGRYVRLVFSDTGHGMDPETVAHIFEPFFTTKDIGRGTGLGLATVYGIVRSLGGAITVDSAPGKGSRITVVLPLVAEGVASPAEPSGAAAAPRPLTIMLVEDDEWVRRVGTSMLQRLGHTVVPAVDGRDALDRWPGVAGDVHLIITDVRMPRLGGFELARAVRASNDRVPLVFMSGYSEQEWRPEDWPGATFLPKPFTAETLATAVERVARAADS